jgi:ribosomal protein L13
MNHPHLGIGQKVIVINADKKEVHGTISQVINDDVAKIDHDNGTFISSFSDKKEPGTFCFEQASPKAESGKHEAKQQSK